MDMSHSFFGFYICHPNNLISGNFKVSLIVTLKFQISLNSEFPLSQGWAHFRLENQQQFLTPRGRVGETVKWGREQVSHGGQECNLVMVGTSGALQTPPLGGALSEVLG